MIVRVPASSANLGPGFDTLGLALGLYLELCVPDAASDVADAADSADSADSTDSADSADSAEWAHSDGGGVRADAADSGGGGVRADAADSGGGGVRADAADSDGGGDPAASGGPARTRAGPPSEEGHPGVRAFRQLGGTGPVWIRTRIPVARGLGFSGSARVAGLVAALAQRHGAGFHPLDEAEQLLHVATALEGHADNIAPSIFGGVVASAGGHAVRVALPFDPAVVVWVPSATTSTEQSRARLCSSVPFADAVFNVGRTALLVAALAAGDIHALRTATEDRLHQDQRFASTPASRTALAAALDAGAWCGWLSGSGPTIATLCGEDEAEALAAALPDDGHTKILSVDLAGAEIER